MVGSRHDVITVTEKLYFGDDYNFIHHLPSGNLKLVPSSSIILSGNVSLPTGKRLNVVDGAVDLGTGALTISGATSINNTLTVARSATVEGDLTRRSVQYMSAAATWTLPSGWTRLISGSTMNAEGVIILSGVSGSITAKLGTPTRGKEVTIIYKNSGGSDIAATAKISSAAFKCSQPAASTTFKYLTFTYPGEAITLSNDGTNWYATRPSGVSSIGPIFSTS